MWTSHPRPVRDHVASANNRIRIPSRKLLDQQLVAAAAIGAKGLIVHGGHVTATTDPPWVRQLAQAIERERPSRCSSRTPRAATTRWPAPDRSRALGGRSSEAAGGRHQVGFCLDTCHATRRHRAAVVSTGCWRSPAGSTWCTARLARRVRLGCRPACELRRGRSTRRRCSTWPGGGRPGRCETPGAGRAPTSPGSATGLDYDYTYLAASASKSATTWSACGDLGLVFGVWLGASRAPAGPVHRQGHRPPFYRSPSRLDPGHIGRRTSCTTVPANKRDRHEPAARMTKYQPVLMPV